MATITVTNKAKRVQKILVDSYQKKLEVASGSCQTKQELVSAHATISLEIEAIFKTKCAEETNMESNLETLRRLLKEVLDEILEIKEFDRGECYDSIPVTDKYFKLYKEEMESQFEKSHYLANEEIQLFHNKISDDVITQCKLLQNLELAQEKTELEKAVKASFEILKARNLMSLNWNTKTTRSPAIGIDLGTTFCCVGVFLKGNVRIIPNSCGKQTTPSYVRLERDGSVTVGNVAKDNAHRYPSTTIFDAKRLIGRSFNDPNIQNDLNTWPFDVTNGRLGPMIFANGREYPPEQISAYLLQNLRDEAEKFLKCPVRKAVITVPAYFNDAQRQATIDAGEMAGLEVLTILNEPTAAAMAYKMERFHTDTRKVLIFDFGGGTFDIAILETNGDKIEVIAVDGDTHLGGEDIDRNLMKHCMNTFQTMTKIDLLKKRNSVNKKESDKSRECLGRVQSMCEMCKIELSTSMLSEKLLDHIFEGHDMDVHFSREDVELLNSSIFEKTVAMVDRLLTSTKVGKDEIDDVILVGGSTRIPVVQEKIKTYFNLGVLNNTINADEAVAYGAAIHAAILNGSAEAKKVLDCTIQDVSPMSLGIECIENEVNGRFSIIIPKATKIPIRMQHRYYTSIDYQECVSIKIYQGENPTTSENMLLGKFLLSGIPPALKGEEKLDVIMEILGTGVLQVTAISRSTKGSNSLQINELRGRLPSNLRHAITRELGAQI